MVRSRHGLVLALPRGPCPAHWPPRSLLARNSSHARRPPGEVPFRNTTTTSGNTAIADFRAIRAVQRSRRSATASPTAAAAAAAVTAQPSAETGDSPSPAALARTRLSGPATAWSSSQRVVLSGPAGQVAAGDLPTPFQRSKAFRRRQGQVQRSPWAGSKPIFAPRPHLHQNRGPPAGSWGCTPGSAAHVKPGHADQHGPSVAVRGRADGAHRPSWRHGRRPLYVRGHRNTSTHGDTP
jgi:hypothetical protein